jgi:hypothetical protein
VVVSEPVETHYQRRERERLEAEAELGEVLKPMFTQRYSPEGFAAVLGWPLALAQWWVGMRQRRRSRRS